MKFYSTSDRNLRVNYEEAVWQGLAPDGGLFMPERLEQLPPGFWKSFQLASFREIAFALASHLLDKSVSKGDLEQLAEFTTSFDAPLVPVEEDVFALELFHGPTLAFKDFGARFLAATMGGFAKRRGEEVTILVATSGDTGGAVAHGFLDVPNTRVVVLYPSGKVSWLQEMQFATLGRNITSLEVSGNFDDCQRLVKEIFADKEIREARVITSANSINIARLIPQMFYYFRAVQQIPLERRHLPVIISVPSGNFGNLTAGLMAKKLGLGVEHFVASTNVNDVVPEYLRTRSYLPRPSRHTLSNAMDVGNPSNFARILDLFNNSHEEIAKMINGYSFTDEETLHAIREVYLKNNYTMDPHGAVAFLGLKRELEIHPRSTGIFLETAHPAKFNEVVEGAIQSTLSLPARLSSLLSEQKKSIRIGNNFTELKDFLIATI